MPINQQCFSFFFFFFPLSNGEDWWKLRKEFQKGFSAPQAVKAYLPSTDSMINDFVSTRLVKPTDDYLPELSRLFLQCELLLTVKNQYSTFRIRFLLLFYCFCYLVTCLVAFDEKFDCFSSDEMKSDSRSSRLMEAALTTNSLILLLDNENEVKKSKSWPAFSKAMLYMEE